MSFWICVYKGVDVLVESACAILPVEGFYAASPANVSSRQLGLELLIILVI